MFDVDYYYYRLSVLMSKFDAIRASGDMMPTAMGTPALDGKKIFEIFFFNNSFYMVENSRIVSWEGKYH